ncbi:hypothetical protein J2S11_000412 [Bacillus horti]|uniref:Uncharacterized protein n=1 Tax=Caldalkalibacillus horti TaxID=77523 RepID=A0ABT9VU49_9BACI|nr:hypothetical protein [Bacillus horti]
MTFDVKSQGPDANIAYVIATDKAYSQRLRVNLLSKLRVGLFVVWNTLIYF